MRVVVTGATGNVGTAVLRRLRADGDHELVGIARRVPARPSADITWVSADLSDDACLPALEQAFAGADAVVHLVWGFQPSHDLEYLEALGVGGTRRVLQAVATTGVPHVVHMSSVGAYSTKRSNVPVDESWPTDGIPTSPYSSHKAAAERLLDGWQRQHDAVVSRMRPGIVGQRAAGSALLRYGLPGLVPRWLLDRLWVVPLDRRLVIPMVHADDVADAVVRELGRRAGGAFNLATDPHVTAEHVAAALGASLLDVPASLLRALLAAAWHLRLQPLDPGWLDLAYAVPLLDSTRARRELGWTPTVDGVDVLQEVVTGMREGAAGDTPVLRPRSVPDALRDFVTRGGVGVRTRP